MTIKKPSSLKPGDTIGIAASSSPFDRDEFQKGTETLKKLGFDVYYRSDIFEKRRYLAGSDQRRAEELVELLENPKIKAVFFARGGYGLLRILPHLDNTQIVSKPKIVLGYSDITSLHLYLLQKYKWTTFYGPVVAKDLSSKLDQQTLESLNLTITSNQILPEMKFAEVDSISHQKATGIITGGCLSLIVASIGTPYEIDTDNKILFLEDTNERPYAVDRMLTQMKLAGKLDKIKGMVCGNFANAGEEAHIREAITDVMSDTNIPILFHFPAGHGSTKITLPLGLMVEIDGAAKSLKYLEAACN